MFNFIILILLLNILLYNKNSSTLACGIFAFFSDSPDNLNWDKFNILGVFNDDRGGDSCGRATEDFADYGIGVNSDYKDLVIGYGSPKERYKTVIGHARKASVGQVKKEFAQPVIFTGDTKFIKKRKGRDKILKEFFNRNHDDNTKVLFAGVHNGTLINYLTLATQYNIDSIDKNDSGVLIEIICRRGLDILTEYVGTAALIWYDFITDTGYAFHGKSASYATNKGKADLATEEKPLFMYKENDTTIYLSSIEDSLKFIGGTDKSIEELDFNTVYVFKNGNVVDKILYDRATLSSQKEPWKETTSTNKSYKTYKTYDDWYLNNGERNNYDDDTPILKWHAGVKLNPAFLDGKVHILWEKRDAFIPANTIFFWKGRYWIAAHIYNGVPELANGVFYLDSFGCRYNQTNAKAHLHYFIDGVKLIDRSAYEKALLLVNKNYTPVEFAREISFYSCYPVHSFFKNILTGSVISCSTGSIGSYQNFFKPINIHADCDSTKSELSSFFSGTFEPIFSQRIYVIERGDLIGISDRGTIKFFKDIDSTTLITPPPVTKTKAKNDLDNFPNCPCDRCNLTTKFCEHCAEFELYNEELVKIGAALPLRKNIGDAEDYTSEDRSYQDLVIERASEIVEDGVTGVQDLIDGITDLGGGAKFCGKILTTLEEIKNKYESLKLVIDDEKSI